MMKNIAALHHVVVSPCAMHFVPAKRNEPAVPAQRPGMSGGPPGASTTTLHLAEAHAMLRCNPVID
jgi:hypothetical protein